MLTNLGLTCVSPGPIRDSLITKLCPKEVTIDLDTARLQFRTARSTLTLSARCIACQVLLDIERCLTRIGIKIQSEVTVCVQPSCVLPAIHMSGRCSRHLDSLLMEARQKITAKSLNAALNTLESASRNRWNYPPEYNIVRCRTEEIL